MHNKLNQNEIEIVCDCGMAKWLQGGAISSIIEKFTGLLSLKFLSFISICFANGF